MSGVLTAPNLLAFSRVPLGVLFWRVADRPSAALAVLGAAAASDVADGWLARRMGLAPHGGAGDWIDPLCDKFFMLSALLSLRRRVRRDPALLARIAAREFVLVPLAILRHGVPRLRVRVDWRARVLGKATTVAQFAAVAAAIAARRWTSPLAAAACLVGLVASADYLRRTYSYAARAASDF